MENFGLTRSFPSWGSIAQGSTEFIVGQCDQRRASDQGCSCTTIWHRRLLSTLQMLWFNQMHGNLPTAKCRTKQSRLTEFSASSHKRTSACRPLLMQNARLTRSN